MVTFRTGHQVTLWPLKIVEAEYLASRASVAAYAELAGVRAEAGLRLRFTGVGGVPISKVTADTLPIYIDGSEHIPGELYRQLAGEAVAVVAGDPATGDRKAAWTKLPLPEPHGFAEECALLPNDQRSFRGYRLLTEYFACPERFLFIRLEEIARAFNRCGGGQCDVVILFKRSAPTLAGAVSPGNLRLFATPAINLFEKQLDRVQVNPHDHEHRVRPDRTKPLDFEVYRVLDVVAHNRSRVDPRPVAPLYAYGALLYDWREALFYVTRLRPRRLSTREQRLRRRSDYVGTETYISLTSPGRPERLGEVQELAVRALVTNRELAEMLRFGGTSDLSITGAPVRAVTVLRSPTRPRPPVGLSDAAWRVIGHLTPNYATLASDQNSDPSILKDHLALYGHSDDPAMRRQVDSVLSVRATPVTRRVPGQDRLAFARGDRIRIELDDGCFENARLFLFASVLEHFLAEFASVNAFTECVFETKQEGVFAQWPPRMGRRRNI